MRRCCEPPSRRRPQAGAAETRAKSTRRGQAVLEFALIFLVIYLLVVAIVEFGRLFTGTQTLQTAVDVAARELSRVPLPSTATFADALANQQVIDGVYDPNYLAINLSAMQPGQSIFDFFAAQGITLPSVNQALLPMMISDTVGGVPLLRYPVRSSPARLPIPSQGTAALGWPFRSSSARPAWDRRRSSGTQSWKRSPIPMATEPSASPRRLRPECPEGWLPSG